MKDWNDYFVDSFSDDNEADEFVYCTGRGFRVIKVNQMIGTPEIEQAHEAEEGAKQRADDLPKSDPGYPYQTVGELVEALFREANGDKEKVKAVSRWADAMRNMLAGNLWGYNARRAAEEARAAQQAAQETKPQSRPEPDNKPIAGEENLFVIADISKTGNGTNYGGW